MIELYKIENTSNKHKEQLKGIEYNDPNFYPNFQNDIKILKNILTVSYTHLTLPTKRLV